MPSRFSHIARLSPPDQNNLRPEYTPYARLVLKAIKHNGGLDDFKARNRGKAFSWKENAPSFTEEEKYIVRRLYRELFHRNDVGKEELKTAIKESALSLLAGHLGGVAAAKVFGIVGGVVVAGDHMIRRHAANLEESIWCDHVMKETHDYINRLRSRGAREPKLHR